jgi:TRAP-type mannitol/chloroaromatic compound transport system permease large subunit
MEPTAILTLLMIASLGAALLAGYPVAFTLAGVALIFATLGLVLKGFLGLDMGPLDAGYIGLIPERMLGNMTNEVLLAVPLFVAMGVTLERSKVAEDLIETLGDVCVRWPGGLGISITLVGALLAASTGIVGATVVTMGLLSLPTMLKRGYDPGFAAGSIAAAGTLGQIIPPSIVLVLLADVLSSAYQESQRALGIFSPQPLSVGELFAGAILPGLGLVLLYILYQAGVAYFRPHLSPKGDEEDCRPINAGRLLRALVAPIVLIVAVLGSILTGFAPPTEAAAVGAVGAIYLGAVRLRPDAYLFPSLGLVALLGLAVYSQTSEATNSAVYQVITGLLTLLVLIGLSQALMVMQRLGVLQKVLDGTLRINVMVFSILIGAGLFALVFRGFGGDAYVGAFLIGLPGGTVGAVLAVMLVMFVLGFFLDFIEITFIVVPIVAPVLLAMGISPIWLGVMMAVNLQTSFLTPPFGFALFYLRGVAPKELKTRELYKGVAPFVVIQLFALVLLSIWPEFATWLPGIIFPH